MRSIYFRQRPLRIKYRGRFQELYANSFVSAHTLIATVLGIIILNFIGNFLATTLITFTIIAIGYSRIKLKKHHLADVIVAWVIGIFLSLLTIKIV